MDCFTWTQQSIKTIEKLVESCMKRHNMCVQRLVLCKRNRDLRDGDISMPIGLVKAVSVEEKQAIKDELLQILSEQKWKVSKVTSPTYCFLAFHYHRETLYRNVLSAVLNSDFLSRRSESDDKRQVLLNVGLQVNEKQTIDDLRCAILLQHVSHLLFCSGYQVSFIPQLVSGDRKMIFENVGLETEKVFTDKPSTERRFSDVLKKYHFQNNRYLIHKEIVKNSKSPETKSESKSLTGQIDSEIVPCDSLSDQSETRSSYTSICRCLGWNEEKRVLSDGPENDDISVDFDLCIKELNLGIGKGRYEKSLKVMTPSGIYPPLPEINSLDFSTLREEDEWELLYNYIFIYGELIAETTEQFIPEDSIISKIHCHKVCNFLVSLSRHLSSYYSRTHVLGENREHLLPTMYARLYLLKVTHQIMCHALSLLGITPLNQL